jgi:ribosomal protein L7Ae-like RNA K-turn-binding protein
MFPGSSVEAIKYPAETSKYNSSVTKGTKELTKRIEKYVNGCGKAKLVLMGYSQGKAKSSGSLENEAHQC